MNDYQITEEDNKLIEIDKQSAVDSSILSPEEEKLLTIRREMKEVNFNGIIAKLSQYVDLAQAVSHIEKTKEYIVKIPLQHQAEFDEGKLFFNENKSKGILWPTLMEKGADGRNHFVGNLPIQEKEFICDNPMRDISNNMYNIALQNQLQDIIVQVEKTYKAVKKIEHGQMDDRKGHLNAGKERIILALTYDDEESKRQAIELGINDLIIAKNQIGETLKRRATEFEPIPDSGIKQRIKVFKDIDYLNDKDTEIQEIQQYYALYLEATKLISTALLIKGEKAAAKLQFENSERFIQAIPFDSLKTIEYSHRNKDLSDMFFYHPVEYIEAEQEIILEQAKDYDCLQIEVTGEELLEVIKNENQEETI